MCEYPPEYRAVEVLADTRYSDSGTPIMDPGEKQDTMVFLAENGTKLLKKIDAEAAEAWRRGDASPSTPEIKGWLKAMTSTQVCSSLGFGYKRWWTLCIF